MSSTSDTYGRSFSLGLSAKRRASRHLYLLCFRERWPDLRLTVASNTGRQSGQLRLRTPSALSSIEATCNGSHSATALRTRDCGKSTGGAGIETKSQLDR